ncbi:MAG: NAD-dependent epimerase/dehydratase family protein [Nanoarchaeota archaeon]|nr:NAD-dependent epimerase/dehydratase family protein [Nanoarchaeota archaeon]
MKILVTGSSGEIGTNLCLKLKKEGHEVFGIDKRKNSWTKDFEYFLLDLSQRFSEFKNGFNQIEFPFKPNAVVHLAANAKVHELVKNPLKAMDNIQLTFNVLEYCRQNNVPIIFSSSREVYGDIHRFNTNEQITDEKKADFKFTESPYSASKIAGEALIYSYAKCYNLPYLIFRFSNVYGRFDNDLERMERVIPLFIKKINKKEPIIVYGKNKILDFTYVDDCVKGIYSGIEKLVSGEVKNETINLAYGEGQSLLNLVEYIEDNLGKKAKVSIGKTQVGEVSYYVADISKAKKLLGYNPKNSLSEGIKKTIEWWKERGDLSL